MFHGCAQRWLLHFRMTLARRSRFATLSRQIEAGIHFLVPCGNNQRSPTLTPAERRRV